MNILSIDPSVNNVGWCLLNTEGKTIRERWRTGLIKPEGINYAMRCVSLLQELQVILQGLETKVHHLVTEWPTFFDSSVGHMAARQNYTVNLAGICGFMAGSLRMDHRSWHMVTATEWKGSVAKNVTQRKMFRHFGKKFLGKISEHEIDATMLLHYWIKIKASSLQVDVSAWPELRG
jgi:hypothetical protein